MEEGYVKSFVSEDGIGEIEFFHPKANSLPLNLLKDLAETFKKFDQDKKVKIITLKSSGNGTFCAGASFEQLKSLKDKKEATNYFMGFGSVINNMINSEKLIITSVQGKAVGGGIGLIAASDYIFAVDSSAVKLSEVSLGIGPFVISEPIIRKISMGHFSSLTLDTEWRDSNWCASVGLFSCVCKDLNELNLKANEFSLKLSKGNLNSYKNLKELFWQDIKGDFKKLVQKRAKISAGLLMEGKE